MTFLNPLVLFGLIAAAIPLILHLLNLRKLRTIEFSTLTFLKELQQTKIRRLKLRQILLLIVRTLLIVLIVLAFARPALRGTVLGAFGTNARSTIVLILDDSFSTSASDAHGEIFRQEKDAALRLLDVLKSGDDAFLVKLSDLPQATVDPATHDIGALRTIVEESQISGVRRRLEDAVRLSAKLLQKSSNANKEIYIVSDMQRTLFTDMSPASEAATSLFADGTSVFLVPVGSSDISNASIDTVGVTTTILEKNKPAALTVAVKNFGGAALNNEVVSVYLDGVKSAQGNVSVEPWGSASTKLNVTPKRTGYLKGYAEIEDDAVEMDNRRYFTMTIPPQIAVEVVSGSSGESRYPLIALGAGSDQASESQLAVQQIPAQKFLFLDLKTVDVLVLTDATALDAGDMQRVKSFVQHGGGLMLFPGASTKLEDLNSVVLPPLGIPPVEEVVGAASLSFQKVDLDHPLFATIFEKEAAARDRARPGVESPSITRTLKRQTGRQGRTIVSLSDGSAFLSEHTLGSGRILFFSVAPVLSWSDFPLKGIFAPLLYRSAVYLAPRDEGGNTFIAGEEPTITVRAPSPAVLEQSHSAGFRLTAPDGTEEIVQPAAAPAQPAEFASSLGFQLKHLTAPGLYDLHTGKTTLSMVAVNTDPLESDTRKATGKEMDGLWKHLGIGTSSVRSITAGDQLAAAILQSRFGTELWKYCAGLALLLAALEMLIAREGRAASGEEAS